MRLIKPLLGLFLLTSASSPNLFAETMDPIISNQRAASGSINNETTVEGGHSGGGSGTDATIIPGMSCSVSGSAATATCCCPEGPDQSAKTLIVTIPGVDPSGKEFDGFVNLVSSPCVEIEHFAYNHDWCSKKIQRAFKKFLLNLKKKTNYCKVQIVAHSAGGVIASRLVSDPDVGPIDVHTLASPLNGGGWGPFARVSQPFIGCLKSEIGAGFGPYNPPAPGSSITHHKNLDDEVLPDGYQDNSVPGAKIYNHAGQTHQGIVTHVGENWGSY